MAKKKNQIVDEVPIDKIESFIEKNFKQILLAVSGLILIFLVGYGIKTYMTKRFISNLNELGRYEVSFFNGNKNLNLVNEFVKKGKEISKVKDYVVLRGMELYTDLGVIDKVKALIADSGNNFKELSDNLLSDLNLKNVKVNNYLVDSYLKPIWYYKAILNSKDKEERKKLYEDFKLKFPDSRLLELLDNWGFDS